MYNQYSYTEIPRKCTQPSVARQLLLLYLEVLGHDGGVGLSYEPGGRGGAAVALRVDGVRAERIGTGTETFHVVGRVGIRGRPTCARVCVCVCVCVLMCVRVCGCVCVCVCMWCACVCTYISLFLRNFDDN